jgi:hypothetical protein
MIKFLNTIKNYWKELMKLQDNIIKFNNEYKKQMWGDIK